ncbi:hypothetical protein CDD81_3830 [Ophiocordyceps australis]|uniref:Fe2OG dioxygenase domain-containing protein n=1 Tax=Ophiocordyceps australis TaxID=1399860 RepID=A0A2C5XP71_9HYPO|nr:hypothetical protein CDD81_3830 [Ophiocordyceps australis]
MAEKQQDIPIPIIDLAPDDLHQISPHVHQAFKKLGFAYFKNHGVPETMVNEAFQWSAKFFALPQQVKEKTSRAPERWKPRGYSGIGMEKTSQDIFQTDSSVKKEFVPDCKESHEMGSDLNTRLGNLWPDEQDIPGFRDFFTRFYNVCYQTEVKLLKVLALSLGLEESYFVRFHSPQANQLRILHYPPIQTALLRQGKAERTGAHTDFGSITMLFQDHVGGLEIADMDQPGNFIPVPYIPGTVVVNAGDLLMRWTNDEYKSALHRVGTATLDKGQSADEVTERRYSIPYFIGPDHHTMVDCVPSCHGPDWPKKYEPVDSSEYMAMRLEAIYSHVE